MNNIVCTMPEIFSNSEFGNLRTMMIEDAPWFVGKDVAKVLGYENVNKAVQMHVDEEDRKTLDFKGFSQFGKSLNLWEGNDYSNKTIVNESGLYSLIIGSKLPSARHFKHWVTSEVLPSIRKHGAYATPITIDNIIANPDFGIKLLQNLKEEQEKRRQLESTVAEMKPKVTYYDVAMRSKDLTPISVIAKDYGMSGAQMNKWLHQKGIQYRVGNTWAVYQKYADKGYTHTRVSNYVGKDCRTHSSFHTCWTQKGRLFIYELMKEDGNLPLIEKGEE